jgi:hypothetical protein
MSLPSKIQSATRTCSCCDTEVFGNNMFCCVCKKDRTRQKQREASRRFRLKRKAEQEIEVKDDDEHEPVQKRQKTSSLVSKEGVTATKLQAIQHQEEVKVMVQEDKYTKAPDGSESHLMTSRSVSRIVTDRIENQQTIAYWKELFMSDVKKAHDYSIYTRAYELTVVQRWKAQMKIARMDADDFDPQVPFMNQYLTLRVLMDNAVEDAKSHFTPPFVPGLVATSAMMYQFKRKFKAGTTLSYWAKEWHARVGSMCDEKYFADIVRRNGGIRIGGERYDRRGRTGTFRAIGEANENTILNLRESNPRNYAYFGRPPLQPYYNTHSSEGKTVTLGLQKCMDAMFLGEPDEMHGIVASNLISWLLISTGKLGGDDDPPLDIVDVVGNGKRLLRMQVNETFQNEPEGTRCDFFDLMVVINEEVLYISIAIPLVVLYLPREYVKIMELFYENVKQGKAYQQLENFDPARLSWPGKITGLHYVIAESPSVLREMESRSLVDCSDYLYQI